MTAEVDNLHPPISLGSCPPAMATHAEFNLQTCSGGKRTRKFPEAARSRGVHPPAPIAADEPFHLPLYIVFSYPTSLYKQRPGIPMETFTSAPGPSIDEAKFRYIAEGRIRTLEPRR
jgi:hypothetical protein